MKVKRIVLRISAVIVALLGFGVAPQAAIAQSASEQWHTGIRYLFVYNTTPIRQRCGILASDGSWFWADILPGQHIYKAIHPSNVAQWHCMPNP